MTALVQRRTSWELVSRPFTLFCAVLAGSLLWGAGAVRAQQAPSEAAPTLRPEVPPGMQGPTAIDPPAARADAVTGRARAKATSGGYTIKDAIQQLAGRRFPGTALNVRPDGEAIPAGDVDGDGTQDWLYRYRAVDDRSTDPSVTTVKSFLRYGGSTFSDRYYDTFYYRSLTPVGNFVGDDKADAISPLNNGAGGFEILEGTTSGYQQVDTKTQTSLTGTKTEPVDLTGNGYDDIVYAKPDSNTVRVVFGAQNPADITTTTYSPSFSRTANFAYAAGDLDGDGTGEIVRVTGDNSSDGSDTSLAVDVFSIGGGGLTKEQSFTFSSPTKSAADFRTALTNIDGADLDELILQDRFNEESTVVFTSSQGSYDSSPITSYPDDLQTAGDLNGDGRADFTYRDAGSGDFVVAFGPSTVSNGLTADLVVNGSAETISFPEPKLFGRAPFGDLDDDGRDEIVAQAQGTSQFGPRLVGASADGSTLQTAKLLYDNSNYNTSAATHATAVTDWGGDATADFVVARVGQDFGANGGSGASVGEVNIYYGDPTTAITPDVTLTHPNNARPQHVVTGDFTDNGTPNLAVTWGSSTSTIEIYEAGQGNTPVHTIDYSDLASGITSSNSCCYASALENVGDVNNDGADDLLVGVPESGTSSTAFLYLGGSSLSTQPDASVDVSAVNTGFFSFPGSQIQGLGDINGDNYDDFAVGVGGQVAVFFGQDGTTNFGSADKSLSPPSGSGVSLYGLPITVGDFNADDIPDLAVSSFQHENSSGAGTEALRIYHGGSSGFDTTPDHALFAPGAPLGASTTNLTQSLGELSTVPDLDGDGSDEILFGTATGFSKTNMLYYAGNGSSAPSVTRVLRAPDQSTGLGADNNNLFSSMQGSAVGDFNGDGTLEAVVAQEGAPLRDAPLYTYQPGTASGPDETPTASDTKNIDSSSDTGTKTTFGNTGTAITFSSGTSGSGDVVVEQYDSTPDGSGTIDARNVSEYRVEISAADGLTVGSGTEVRFDVSKLSGVNDPSQVSIFTRELPGLGGFTKLSTTYDAADNELVATVSGFSEFAFGSDTEPLPVELADFTATTEDGAVRLSWTTVSETNNAGFRVQRRVDEQEASWTTVGSVDGAGTTTQARQYQYTDAGVPYEAARVEYRLKQVDTDGGTHYSEAIAVERRVDAVQLLGTAPNPVRLQATVRYALPERRDVTIRLYDVLGRQVRTVVQGERQGRHEQRLDLDGLSSGVYVLRLEADGQVRTQKLTVVR